MANKTLLWQQIYRRHFEPSYHTKKQTDSSPQLEEVYYKQRKFLLTDYQNAVAPLPMIPSERWRILTKLLRMNSEIGIRRSHLAAI